LHFTVLFILRNTALKKIKTAAVFAKTLPLKIKYGRNVIGFTELT